MPSTYVIAYLNELGKYCSLKVVFEKLFDKTRPDAWKKSIDCKLNFDVEILKGIGIGAKIYGDNQGYAPNDKALSLSVIKHISKNYDLIIIGNPCTPTGIIAELYMQLKKIPYAIISEGGFPGNGKGIKERLKYKLMHKSCLFFSTCPMDDDYFFTYGATKDRIRRYNFTSMYRKDIPGGVISAEEKKEIKKKLGIPKGQMILTVGRSVPVKGFDTLIKAFNGVEERVNILEQGEKTSLYFVGADKLDEYDKIIQKDKIENIYFINNIPFEDLKEYYKAADLFVFPTRGDTWGLVINEAMAYGLPIISTDMCVAADALIDKEKGGIIVHVDDINAIRNAMICFLNNPKGRANMGQYNHKKIRNNTIEQMGIIISKHIEEYCKSKDGLS